MRQINVETPAGQRFQARPAIMAGAFPQADFLAAQHPVAGIDATERTCRFWCRAGIF